MKRQTTRSSYYEFWIMLRSLQDLSKRLYKIINRTWHFFNMPDFFSIQHHCFGDSKIFVQPNAFLRSSVDIEVENDRNKTRKTCSDVKHRKRLYNIYTVYREMFAPLFIFVPFALRMGEFNTANNISLIHLHLGEKKTGRNRLQL